MAKRWHQFVPGTVYNRDEVVAVCEMHLRSGRLKNPAGEEAWFDKIRRCPHDRLVWAPFGSSWGLSPMNPNAWRTETGEPIWEPHVIPTVVKRQAVDPQPRGHSLPAAHLRPVKSTTPGGRTIMYGDIAVPVLERNWQGRSEPYRYVNRLKPGERWHDAKVSSNPQKNPARERYVQLPEGSIPPGAIAARELLTEGASLAVWTDCWAGHAVFMSPDLICVELTGELWDILQKIKATTANRWSGLPDAIAVFPDGRIVMRDMKFAGKDKLTETQHTFARVARSLFPDRIEFGVIEWGRVSQNQT